jgi:hypothetical protein
MKKYNAVAYERCFVSVVDEIIKEEWGTYSKFAKEVKDASEEWPDGEAAVNKLRRIRNASKHGKPQKLTLADAFAFSQLIGIEFPSLAFKVFERMKTFEYSEKNEIELHKKAAA